MTLFIHLYCVIWISLLTACCSTTGRELPSGQNVVSVAPIEVPDDNVLAVLEPQILRDDGKRADGMWMWRMGRALVWDAICAETLAASYSRNHQTGRRRRGAPEARERSNDTKYKYIGAQYDFVAFGVETLLYFTLPRGPDFESMYPRFAEPIPNVTVTVGRDALLACVVDNLRGFKVAWVRMDTQTILSIHHNIITQNPRISLSYNDHRSWYLHIKNVQEVDRGWYMCQVNTDPMRSRKGYLQVVVPPSIIDNMTSTDMVVREGSDVTLVCRASGYPEPYVMWRREDGQDFNYNGESVSVVDGETLTITKVSRLHMGAYLCIASNGVPPSISKRIMLMVQFPPMLSIPNQLEGAYIGQDVTLECHTEAYPSSINYWTTDRGDMIISGGKYEAYPMDSGYNKFMMLKIRNISKDDFGHYKCVAKNSLGETDGIIKLDEIPAPPSAYTTTQKPIMDNQTIRKKGQLQNIQTNDAISSNFQGEVYGEQMRGYDFDEIDNASATNRLNLLLVPTLLGFGIIIRQLLHSL